ncbi:MAG TPA: hypothetical protein VJ867_10780 [Gemmatimonadaceae bacterium]|nr:hypothetical protein [Gemmatimonadaceae bacterium]
MQIFAEPLPPPMVIALVGTVVWGCVAIALGVPLIRAWTRRWERRVDTSMPSDVTARLARIETALDSVALEVERIAEAQRFLTKLQTERQPLPRGDNAAGGAR